jgi:hypothetical protein
MVPMLYVVFQTLRERLKARLGGPAGNPAPTGPVSKPGL